MVHANDLIDFLQKNNFEIKDINTNTPYININDNVIRFNLTNNEYSIDGFVPGHSRILDLSKPENHSVIMVLIKLFQKGYSKDVITLEKQWQLGHNDSGSLDIMLKNPNNKDIYMIEVKTALEIYGYVNLKKETKVKQVFSYAIQEKKTKIISFYAYDFEQKKDLFYNVYTENILKESQNVDDFYERWNKQFDNNDYICKNDIFNIKQDVRKYEDLIEITGDVTQNLFNQFATILRLYSISDKPSAFMKMINLLLAKIADESTGNKLFKVRDKYNNTHSFNGLKFQYINGIDTPESFMKRLNELYKKGMLDYLQRDVIDYDDEEIESVIENGLNNELLTILDNLRLKKNNSYSFIEVFDDNTFLENQFVVRDVVELIEKYKFKYGTRQEFLGDFFERLLNTSLKQDEGQFFTPYPLVDFMVDVLPYEEHILDKINDGQLDVVPKIIDYACGAGHFLISSMYKTQTILRKIASDSIVYNTEEQKRKIKIYGVEDPYSWVNRTNVVGVEKDYRLAKTSKIACFLNGDGDAEIIAGDGINKFNSSDYKNTVLYSENKKKIEKFDYVISNPPYSVDGYMRNLRKNDIDATSNDFELLHEMNYSDSSIEKLFVERACQLVKKGGYVAIVLPQSILAGDKYKDLRRYIFKNFTIKVMLLTADITFSGTTTSPVVLIMKKGTMQNIDYDVCIVGSPKYLDPKGDKMKNKEIAFLGYEFSSNKSKEPIKYIENSTLKHITPYIHNYVYRNSQDEFDKFSSVLRVVNMKDIVINASEMYCGDIYPKYISVPGEPLSKYCKINNRTAEDFECLPNKYLEIGNIDENDMAPGEKDKSSKRYCKKGDILVSCLNPTKNKIQIANGDYKLSAAIYVLSDFKDDETKQKVFKELRKSNALQQMNSMCEGFKITYAKISAENLYKNVKITI